MEIKQLIDEAIRKKLGIKDGLPVEKATVTVCAGSDDVIIESVLMMAGRQEEVDTRPPPTPKPSEGRRGGHGKLRRNNASKGKLDRISGASISDEDIRELRIRISVAKASGKLSENQLAALKESEGVRIKDLNHAQREQIRNIVEDLKRGN